MKPETVYRRAIRIFCVTTVLFLMSIVVAIWTTGSLSNRCFATSAVAGGVAVISGITAAVAAWIHSCAQ